MISSTSLRRLIEVGDVSLAAHRMGRPYSVTAPVLHGKRIGHSLGFPTVNQRIPADKVMPAFGVYACKVRIPDGSGETSLKNGVCNIGCRPTVNGDQSDVTMETYLFDYEGDLYGEIITVSLCKRLRGECRFSSKEELSRQIARDKSEAMDYFKTV
jgi:riboflavin kinase/FMN adenylyltransferase